MAKSKNEKPSKTAKQPTEPLNAPWIKMRTAIILIVIVSVGMAVMTGYQAHQQGRSLIDSILLGLLFGGLIWVIFFGNYWLNRWLRRPKK